MFSRKIKKPQRDEFVERMLCTVPGMTHEGNLFLFEKAIAELPAGTDVLEIGSFCGQSAILLHYFLRKFNKQARIFCIDPFFYEGWKDKQQPGAEYLNSVGGSSLSRTDYRQFVEASFHRNVSFFCPEQTPVLYKMMSDEFFKKLHAGDFSELNELKIGFAYVDGDHAKQAAMNDVKNCVEKMASGGWLLMDDSARGSTLGSAEAAKEIAKWTELKLVEENPNFLFRKK